MRKIKDQGSEDQKWKSTKNRGMRKFRHPEARNLSSFASKEVID